MIMIILIIAATITTLLVALRAYMSARLARVPQMVSRAQGKVALIQAGLWAQVLSFVAAIDDPLQKAVAEVALNDTSEWRRDSPFLAQAGAALGLTAEQLDDLFVAAAQVTL